MTIKGSCSCGRVAYKIDGKLHDGTSCHCSTCRKASGSQSSSYAIFEPGTFAWSAGEESLTIYKYSEEMGTVFCSVCGSPLAGTYQGEISWVTLGSVDGDPQIQIEKHIFMGSKAPWETRPSDVQQYDEFSE
ncbi:MAG: GFA family protein [Candidatus Thiodiazotropha sp. DIVDIV]